MKKQKARRKTNNNEEVFGPRHGFPSNKHPDIIMNADTDNIQGFASFHEGHNENEEHSDATNAAADAFASLSNNFV